MKVGMVIRPRISGRHGGDLVQADMTARELRRRGVEVTITCGEGIPAADIVHIFNMQTPEWTLGQVVRASKHGKPVVLSPIYWNSLSLVVGGLLTLPSIVPFLPRALAEAREEGGTADGAFPLLPLGQRARVREILRRSRLILPNSRAELGLILAEFPELSNRPNALRVVPNGVDLAGFEPGEPEPLGVGVPLEPGGYILCVGRIDFRKNQLRLIRAVQGLGIPLVCVGDPVLATPWHTAYYRACRASGSGVTFLAHRGPKALWPLYANCALHCLPSYFETPGLSNLEAALAGARVVTTAHGATREYFGSLAQYCDPQSVASIRLAMERALASPPPSALRELVRERYTWRRAAELTLAAYEEALAEPAIYRGDSGISDARPG